MNEQNIEKSPTSNREGAGAQPGTTGGPVQYMKSALRGRGYDEQVQMLAPGGAAVGDKAEVQRLTEEMNKLAMRNAWTGVDAKYTAILELGIAPSGQVYKLAAEASRNLGDVREQQQRLRLAQGAGEDVSLELEAIERAFGTVRIASASGKKLKKNEVGPELTPAMSPFAPDLRAAIESARKELQATGTFSGMLPAGDYTAGSKAFTVVAGDDSQVLYEAD